MKLYKLTKGDKILEETSDGGKEITFGHIDGKYGHCTTDKGGVVYLSATSELVETKGGYKLKSE